MIVLMIARLYCRLFNHKWRKPHVGEAADSRYCNRCGVGRAVRKRKAKAAQ